MNRGIDVFVKSSAANLARFTLTAAVLATVLVGCASAPQQPAGEAEAEVKKARLKTRAQSISEAHKKSAPQLRHCFEQGADTAGQAQVEQVELELRLPASGTPSSIRLLDAEAIDPQLRQCLEEALAGVEYGQSRRGQTFYQTFRFDRADRSIKFDRPLSAYKRWGLTRKEMMEVLVAHKPQMDQCYALAADGPTGRVVLTITITAAGPPAKVGLKSSTLNSTEANMCLVETVLDMEFPEPRGEGVTVRDMPLIFNPDEAWVLPKN